MEYVAATGARAASERKTKDVRSPGGQVRRANLRNPLEDDGEILQTVIRFLGDDAYLFVASVSTRWRYAWGQQPTVTSPRWAVKSCSCLKWALGCGLDIWDNPCLHAAAEGRLDVLEFAVALGYSRECMPVCEYAAGGGHLEVVKWCHANGYPWGRSSLRAAEEGHLEVLQWCMANGCPRTVARQFMPENRLWMIPFGAIDSGAEGGKLDIVKWCRTQGDPWGTEACYLAARGGHFELLRWMRANGCPWSSKTMLGAIEAGDLDMLMWCVANGCPRSSKMFALIARHGNLDFVKWYVENHPDVNQDDISCVPAAVHGHLKVVQWLRASGRPWGRMVCYSAASEGHFEVLKWCVENGCPWDCIPATSRGAFKGDLPLLLWATANGCPWACSTDDFTHLCKYIAEAGNLELLQWCETLRAIPTQAIVRAATKRGHVHVLEWLRKTGRLLEGHTDPYLCYLAASVSGSLEMLQWCRTHGQPWGEKTCESAARSGNLKLLQWCKGNGCPWDKETCKAAAERGDLEMLAWCRANGCPWDASLEFSARLKGNEEVAKWCKAHGPVTGGQGRMTFRQWS